MQQGRGSQPHTRSSLIRMQALPLREGGVRSGNNANCVGGPAGESHLRRRTYICIHVRTPPPSPWCSCAGDDGERQRPWFPLMLQPVLLIW